MLDDRFKKRYREIPLAIHSIQPAKKYEQKTHLTLLHIHEEIEILHITDGQAMVYLGGKEYCAESGDTLFVSPWSAHRADIVAGKFGYICVCFDASLLGGRSPVKEVTEGKRKLPGLVKDKEIARMVKKIAADYKQGGDGWDYFAQGELMKIFGRIVSEKMLEKEEAVPENDFSVRAYNYIKNNYAEHITSKDCSESLHLDQSSFCRKFKECFGTTFGKYLCAFRLERAKQLLEDGTLSVTEIGNRTGFTGTSYFIMKYKQVYGLTPKKNAIKEKKI